MCVYCMIPEWGQRWIPNPGWPPYRPSDIDPYPYPEPSTPQPTKWTKQMLKEFEDIMERVRKLEEAAGGGKCREADPSKMDFIKKLRTWLDEQEEEDRAIT